MDDDLNILWKALTAESIAIIDAVHACIAAHRLRQNKPQYPLRHITSLDGAHVTPALLSALAATTTLESICVVADEKEASVVAEQLKSIPRVHAVSLRNAPAHVRLELLLTRTDWSCIDLAAQHASNASEQIARNRTDFELSVSGSKECEDLCKCLTSPHLTALKVGDVDALAPSFWSSLSQCQILIRLVFVALTPCMTFTSHHLLFLRT